MSAVAADVIDLTGARLVVNVDRRLKEWAGPFPMLREYPEESLMYRVMREREAALIRSSDEVPDGGLSSKYHKQWKVLDTQNRIREIHKLIQVMPPEYKAVVVIRYIMRVNHRKQSAVIMNWTVDRWRLTCAGMYGWLEAKLGAGPNG